VSKKIRIRFSKARHETALEAIAAFRRQPIDPARWRLDRRPRARWWVFCLK